MTSLLFILFLIAAATASFDLIGSFDLAGGNLRITNVVMILFGAGGLIVAYARGVPRVRGFGWIVVWTLWNAACMYNAPGIFRTYAYTIWLAVDVLFIFAVTAAVRGDRIWSLAQANYFIYGGVAALGLAQFALAVVGVDILVKQRLSARLPRINGFSYEPSYFATYLIVGWGVSLYLLLHPVDRISSRVRWLVFLVCTFALVLCTSRLGYFGMAVMLVMMSGRIVSRLWSAGKAGIAAVLLGGAGLIAGTAAATIALRQADPTVLLEGTGLGGTHAHSVDVRFNEFLRYWNLFREHPMRGYSLGGIAGVVAGAGGIESVDYETLRKSQGINVSFEVILATGIAGAPLFFIYLYKLTIGPIVARFRGADPELVIMAKANAWGLALQFFMLQFNQNILRNYFWIQVAVVSCLVSALYQQRREARTRGVGRGDSATVPNSTEPVAG